MKEGYKLWVVVLSGEEIRLGSIRLGYYTWKPGINLAECIPEILDDSSPSPHPEGERVPAEKCECGIYARKKMDDKLYEYYRNPDLSGPPCKVMADRSGGQLVCDYDCSIDPRVYVMCFEEYVFGAVMLSGRIIEKDEGFRAEEAQIRVLFSNYIAPCLIPELEKIYQVPVVEARGLPSLKGLLDISWGSGDHCLPGKRSPLKPLDMKILSSKTSGPLTFVAAFCSMFEI